MPAHPQFSLHRLGRILRRRHQSRARQDLVEFHRDARIVTQAREEHPHVLNRRERAHTQRNAGGEFTDREALIHDQVGSRGDHQRADKRIENGPGAADHVGPSHHARQCQRARLLQPLEPTDHQELHRHRLDLMHVVEHFVDEIGAAQIGASFVARTPLLPHAAAESEQHRHPVSGKHHGSDPGANHHHEQHISHTERQVQQLLVAAAGVVVLDGADRLENFVELAGTRTLELADGFAQEAAEQAHCHVVLELRRDPARRVRSHHRRRRLERERDRTARAEDHQRGDRPVGENPVVQLEHQQRERKAEDVDRRTGHHHGAAHLVDRAQALHRVQRRARVDQFAFTPSHLRPPRRRKRLRESRRHPAP